MITIARALRPTIVFYFFATTIATALWPVDKFLGIEFSFWFKFGSTAGAILLMYPAGLAMASLMNDRHVRQRFVAHLNAGQLVSAATLADSHPNVISRSAVKRLRQGTMYDWENPRGQRLMKAAIRDCKRHLPWWWRNRIQA